ncbi:hypothetical protein [Tenacibaculum agarivorans]|uniref:hypothetical protein n=1 Tax=Tenacibaculum agarivorans TaxID=1908389 RepID=UPI00094BA0DE|nr:hypothetical protein [Tenacibaculum agarivorans]
MNNYISSASFSVSNFLTGASAFTSIVKEGYKIQGYRTLVENVSGGSAKLSLQFWKEGKPLGKPHTLEISDSKPPGNFIIAPKFATLVVISFGVITFPMGTILLSVSVK